MRASSEVVVNAPEEVVQWNFGFQLGTDQKGA
jgi:hypothetical protein